MTQTFVLMFKLYGRDALAAHLTNVALKVSDPDFDPTKSLAH
jgi:hypothetical protein